MKLQIKYTPDGKKVLLQDIINQNEHIVQEIIVIDGEEIPSGVSFITKILYDDPIETWYEKELKKQKERYDKVYDANEREIVKLKKEHSKASNELKQKLSHISKMVDKVSPEDFELLGDYITGNIKYVVVIGYDFKIVTLEDFNQMYENKLRLISFFGQSNGEFRYSMGEYSDWSGGHKTFIPCRTYSEAKEILQNHIDFLDSYSEYTILIGKEHGLNLDKDKIKEYKKMRIEHYEKELERMVDSQELTKEKISKLKSL